MGNNVADQKEKKVNTWVTLGMLAVGALIIFLIASSRASKSSGQNAPASATSGGVPTLVGTKTYSSAPPMLIDTGKSYTATFKMARAGNSPSSFMLTKPPSP